MQYKFFTNSERAWKAMFEAIKNAKEYIYLEMYIFSNDMVQYDFLTLLKEKAQNGVRVRIVLDSSGSSELSKNAVVGMRESGAELLFQSYFFHRTHRKILVVDGLRAFIGGVNLSQRFRFWNDLVIEVKGKKLIKHIIRSFAKVYSQSRGDDKMVLAQNRPIALDKTRTWLVEHFPVRKKYNLKKIYKENLHQAKESIVLVTPYFMPSRWFIVALHQAVLRGVKVEVLVPKTTNNFWANRVGYFFMYKLSKLGVNFLLEPKMNHAKAMIIDNREGIVGSNNLDFISFELNSEVGIFLKDINAVRKLSGIVQEWKKEAIVFDYKAYKPKIFDYFLSPVIRIFFRVW
ncbi:MAG: phospholipase D-like domain-containing protein [Candidatus Paceibacterota bacterium]